MAREGPKEGRELVGQAVLWACGSSWQLPALLSQEALTFRVLYPNCRPSLPLSMLGPEEKAGKKPPRQGRASQELMAMWGDTPEGSPEPPLSSAPADSLPLSEAPSASATALSNHKHFN